MMSSVSTIWRGTVLTVLLQVLVPNRCNGLTVTANGAFTDTRGFTDGYFECSCRMDTANTQTTACNYTSYDPYLTYTGNDYNKTCDNIKEFPVSVNTPDNGADMTFILRQKHAWQTKGKDPAYCLILTAEKAVALMCMKRLFSTQPTTVTTATMPTTISTEDISTMSTALTSTNTGSTIPLVTSTSAPPSTQTVTTTSSSTQRSSSSGPTTASSTQRSSSSGPTTASSTKRSSSSGPTTASSTQRTSSSGPTTASATQRSSSSGPTTASSTQRSSSSGPTTGSSTQRSSSSGPTTGSSTQRPSSSSEPTTASSTQRSSSSGPTTGSSTQRSSSSGPTTGSSTQRSSSSSGPTTASSTQRSSSSSVRATTSSTQRIPSSSIYEDTPSPRPQGNADMAMDRDTAIILGVGCALGALLLAVAVIGLCALCCARRRRSKHVHDMESTDGSWRDTVLSTGKVVIPRGDTNSGYTPSMGIMYASSTYSPASVYSLH